MLLFNPALRSATARTENDLLVVFQVLDGSELRPSDLLDIPLPDVLVTGRIRHTADEKTIDVRLARADVHDLRAAVGGHGAPSNVSDERMSAP